MLQTTQYRFNFTALRPLRPSQNPADAIQLSEVRFYAPDGEQHYWASGYGATNPFGRSPYTQGALNLIDGNLNHKWYVWQTPNCPKPVSIAVMREAADTSTAGLCE